MSEIRPPNIFNAVNDVLYKCEPDCLQNVDALKEYTCFMVNRWVTMHSSNACLVVNATVNAYWQVLQDKHKHHMLLRSVLPTCRRTRLVYATGVPKKEAISTKESTIQEKIALFAKANELSRREIEEYIASGMLTFEA